MKCHICGKKVYEVEKSEIEEHISIVATKKELTIHAMTKGDDQTLGLLEYAKHHIMKNMDKRAGR